METLAAAAAGAPIAFPKEGGQQFQVRLLEPTFLLSFYLLYSLNDVTSTFLV